jgi:4-amino-4-deoxy-L-arabinose transferase-like glycosyltransferase
MTAQTAEKRDRGTSSARTLLSAALGMAFVLRVAAVLLRGDISSGANLWEYGKQGACALQNGGDLCLYYPQGGASYTSAYMPPLLSYFWLGLFHVFGDGSAARTVWLAANVAAALGCVALIFYLGLKLWPSSWAAFAAAMLFAVYPTFVFVTATYHQTNWAVLLLLAVTAIAVELATTRRPWVYGALGGLVCGLAALNRSEMLVIGPVLIALGAAWRRSPRFLLRVGLASALAMVLTLTPWTVRNYDHFGRLIPTAQSTGYNLWKGFNPYTNGSGNLSEDMTKPGGQELLSIRQAVPPGSLYETRLQDAFMEAFKTDVESASTGRLTELTANKVLLLWGFDWTDEQITGSPAYIVPWLGANLLAIVGLITAWRWRRYVRAAPAVIYAAALGLLTVAYIVTAVHARYRYSRFPVSA